MAIKSAHTLSASIFGSGFFLVFFGSLHESTRIALIVFLVVLYSLCILGGLSDRGTWDSLTPVPGTLCPGGLSVPGWQFVEYDFHLVYTAITARNDSQNTGLDECGPMSLD